MHVPSPDAALTYFKQKLFCYNSTIYEQAKPKDGHCYRWSEVEGERGSNGFLFTSVFATGAEFHRAMVATGEKLIGRRIVRNWARRMIASLFLCRKLHLFLGKSTITAATRAALLTPICTKSFVG